MITHKGLIQNALMREIISIRIDTLWKMLGLKRHGLLPASHEEGATGKFDNKGAIFIPGGIVYQDVDESPIRYDKLSNLNSKKFREKILLAMRFDNATLLFPDGIAVGINLDSGFFSKAARRIFTYKRATFRRKAKVGSHNRLKIQPEDIIRSHCPTYLGQPYGSRTRISTCAAVGLIDPPMFFAYCDSEFNLSDGKAAQFAQRLDTAQEPAVSANGDVLYAPHIVVCHDTRYKKNSLTGLTRILGIGKFGEFATLSFEMVNKALIGELKRKNQSYADDDIIAQEADCEVLAILRIYSRTNPGKRSQRYALQIISPTKHLELDLQKIKAAAKKRYHLLQ
jgi:hypothetical protein